jgi:hypothetical protein
MDRIARFSPRPTRQTYSQVINNLRLMREEAERMLTTQPAASKAPGGAVPVEIRVRMKDNGETGTILESEFNPATMERIP